MKVAIVEDEDLVAEELKSMLSDLAPQLTIEAHLDSVSSAVAWLQENTVDLLFLDINLGDGNSFSIFEQVDINTPVIFTTAYDEYAMQAFEVNSIDFLLKPIDEEDLKSALQKVEDMRQAFIQEPTPETQTVNQRPFKKRFLSVGSKKMRSISEKDIAYFRAEGKHLSIIDTENKTHLLESTLKELETQLDPDVFFRINRRMIINYNAIESVISFSKNRKKVMIIPSPTDPLESIISQDRTKSFLTWLDQ